MKRVSEVFELPVAVGGGMFDKDTIYGADGNGEWAATFETDEQAQHAAHAINHVDALADALEFLLKELDLTYVPSSNLSDAIESADIALVAYRGTK